jgi:hypothetical protein
MKIFFWCIVGAIAMAYLAWAWTISWLQVPKPTWIAEASRRRILRVFRGRATGFQVVCMDCAAIITPGDPSALSHGLCPKCATQWRAQLAQLSAHPGIRSQPTKYNQPPITDHC